MNYNFNDLSKSIHDNAVAKGFYEVINDHTPFEKLMLVVTEVSEAVEAYRNGKVTTGPLIFKNDSDFEERIKDTIEDELADAAIRLLDLAGFLKIDLDYVEKQMENPDSDNIIKAVKSMSFLSQAYTLCAVLTDTDAGLENSVNAGLGTVFLLAEAGEIDLMTHIYMKMAYNEHRPYKHNKVC